MLNSLPPLVPIAPLSSAPQPKIVSSETISATTVPLEVMDNPDMDLISSADRIAAARAQGLRGAAAKSRFFKTDGSFEWAPCVVVSYDPTSELHEIVWRSNGRSKQVKRLALLFDDEGPDALRRRLHRARKYKAEVENVARYYEYIDAQPMRNPNLITEEIVRRLQIAAGEDLVASMPEVANQYIRDTTIEYERAVKKAIVDREITTKPAVAADLYERFQIRPKLDRPPVPEQGTLPLHVYGAPYGQIGVAGGDIGPEYQVHEYERENFTDLYLDVATVAFQGKPSFLLGLQLYYEELEISGLLLVDKTLDMVRIPCSLDEFLDVQSKAMNDTADALKGGWVLRTHGMIDDVAMSDQSTHMLDQLAAIASDPSLSSVHSAESAETLFRRPIMRFVKSLSLRMADQLWSMVLHSVSEYKDIFERYAFESGSSRAHLGIPRDEATGRWGADLAMPVPTSLFRVQLVHVGQTLAFEPSLESLCASILDQFDRMVRSVSEVADVTAKFCTAGTGLLPSIESSDEYAREIRHARDRIEDILNANLEGPRRLLASFDHEFEALINSDVATYVASWRASQPSLEANVEEINRFHRLAQSVMAKSEASVFFNLICVDCSGARKNLAGRAMAIRQALQAAVCAAWNEENNLIVTRYEELCDTLSKEPQSTEDMDDLAKFLEATEAELPSLEERIHVSTDVYKALQNSQYGMSDDDSALFWDMRHWPSHVADVAAHCRKVISNSRSSYMDQLKSDQKALLDSLTKLQAEIDEFSKLGDLNAVEDRLGTVTEIEAKIQRCTELAELYSSREQIFGLTPVEYPQLASITKTFEPYVTLWKTCADFSRALPDWMDGPFTGIDSEKVATESDKWFRASAKLMKALVGPAGEVVRELRKKLEKFLEVIPLVTALRNPGLRDRHWERIAQSVGFTAKADHTFSLSRAIILGLPAHVAVLEEVSEFASKEYALERALDKMQGDWTGQMFSFASWRETGTYILRGIDDIQMLLDDQIVKTQCVHTFTFSPVLSLFCHSLLQALVVP